jgi:hypothetical protein
MKAFVASIYSTATSTVTGKRYTLREGLEQLIGMTYQTIVKKKPFDKKIFLELSLGVHQILCDHIATFVKEHKDLVLLGGAPGWSIWTHSSSSLDLCLSLSLLLSVFVYSLVTICTRPSLFTLFIFCCITSFYGVHYSTIPGLPLSEGDEDEDSNRTED